MIGTLIALMLIFPTAGHATQEIPATEGKTVKTFTYDDGCEVSNNLEEPKVLNPEDCPDKVLVKMLNCGGDVSIMPAEEQPEECK